MVKWECIFILIFVNNLQAQKASAYIDRLSVVSYNKSFVRYINATTLKLTRKSRTVELWIKFKKTPSENTMVSFKCFKFVGNTYKLTAIQTAVKLKTFLTFELLGFDKLFNNYTTPPMAWPLRSDVLYHSHGWAPDTVPSITHNPSMNSKVSLNWIEELGWSMIQLDVYGHIEPYIKS